MAAYVYLLKCSNNSLYCGWTNDPEHRLQVHNAGMGSRYTKAHLPVEMVYLEEMQSKNAALSREFQIKHLTKGQKLELVDSELNLLRTGKYQLNFEVE